MNPAIELAAYYRDHFRAFAFDCLHIALEAGGVGRLDFNPTQLELHRRLEEQRQLTGKVRAVVLKPRREGMSTYIGARFFHKTIFGDGIHTTITTHLDEATKTLFRMVKLFHAQMPAELRPAAGEDSANSLSFTANRSRYALTTARSTSAGRGSLAHLFHGSEVAYWHNAEDVVASVVETVGNQPGTEIIFESTGAPGTYFEDLWYKAVKGGGMMPVFFPWYESARNRADANGLIPDAAEKELLATFPGMTPENLAFRREKLTLSSEAKFRREYPATPADAFSADEKEAFIAPEIVERAAARRLEPFADLPRILGVDPSQTADGDFTGMCLRQGCRVLKVAKFRRETVQERADVIRRFFEQHRADHLFIDQGGSGKEIYDLLIQWGMGRNNLTLVPFGAKASNSRLYPNKRVEMYADARNWLIEEGSIINDLEFKAELSLTKAKINNNGQEVLESKRGMRRSPNLADAFALTFAYPVTARRQGNIFAGTY